MQGCSENIGIVLSIKSCLRFLSSNRLDIFIATDVSINQQMKNIDINEAAASGDDMTAEALMKHAGVRPTAVRLMIYRFLQKASHPLSSLDIETALETVDRSTISRTLTAFIDHDLIHSINDGSGSVKYEICSRPHQHSVSDMHVHFHCVRCGKTYCLPTTAVPTVDLPDGFVMEGVNYVVTGLCNLCS